MLDTWLLKVDQWLILSRCSSIFHKTSVRTLTIKVPSDSATCLFSKSRLFFASRLSIMWLYMASFWVNLEHEVSCGAGNWGWALCCSSCWSLLALAMRQSNAFSPVVCTGSALSPMNLTYGFPNRLDREIGWVNSAAVQVSDGFPFSDKLHFLHNQFRQRYWMKERSKGQAFISILKLFWANLPTRLSIY